MTGYDPNTDPVDAVRFLLGDTTSPFQLQDAEILFALDQNSNIYGAAAICARALAGRYARQVDDKFETIESKNSQLRQNFEMLARSLDQQAKRRGGIGTPIAGGVSRADVESARENEDRVKPFFYDNLLNNAPPSNE
jgi:hypothetical protein